MTLANKTAINVYFPQPAWNFVTDWMTLGSEAGVCFRELISGSRDVERIIQCVVWNSGKLASGKPIKVQDMLNLSFPARVMKRKSYTWTTLRFVDSQTDARRDLESNAYHIHAGSLKFVCVRAWRIVYCLAFGCKAFNLLRTEFFFFCPFGVCKFVSRILPGHVPQASFIFITFFTPNLTSGKMLVSARLACLRRWTYLSAVIC